MMAPLVARDLVLGVATFYRTRPVGPFGSDDVTLAGELAPGPPLSIDNARLYHREHETAVVLQRSMLPQHITPPPGIEVAHRYLPASDINEVGGDWYDVLHLPDGKTALLIGDVMGHGIAAAAVMGRLSATVRALARLDMTPAELLHQLEATLADLAEPMLATFLYAVCDPATGRCTITRAGHPPPAAAAPDGTVRLLKTPPGAPLGVGGIDFSTTDVVLPPGSVLVLYTDGLIEARRPRHRRTPHRPDPAAHRASTAARPSVRLADHPPGSGLRRRRRRPAGRPHRRHAPAGSDRPPRLTGRERPAPSARPRAGPYR